MSEYADTFLPISGEKPFRVVCKEMLEYIKDGGAIAVLPWNPKEDKEGRLPTYRGFAMSNELLDSFGTNTFDLEFIELLRKYANDQ